jgi:hypothetical protein
MDGGVVGLFVLLLLLRIDVCMQPPAVTRFATQAFKNTAV